MIQAKRKNNGLPALKALVLALLCVGIVGMTASFGRTQPDSPQKGRQAKDSPARADLFDQSQDLAFVYQREGRPDPFFPFLTQQILQAEALSREKLTGMRKFEPGQLSLVAVVFTEKEPLAMVQDAAGIGYILRKGTKIGRSGEVADIVPNKVIIKQQTYSLTREKEYRAVEMVLKQEGDKKK